MSTGPLNSPGVRIIIIDGTMSISSSGGTAPPDPFRTPIRGPGLPTPPPPPPPLIIVSWDPTSVTEDGGQSTLSYSGGVGVLTVDSVEWLVVPPELDLSFTDPLATIDLVDGTPPGVYTGTVRATVSDEASQFAFADLSVSIEVEEVIPELVAEWDPDSITEDGGMSALIASGGTPPYTYEFEWFDGGEDLEFAEDENEVTVNIVTPPLDAEWTVADFDTTSFYANTSFDALEPGFVELAMFLTGGLYEPSESMFLTPIGGTGPYTYDLSAVQTGDPVTADLEFVNAGDGEFYIDYVDGIDGVNLGLFTVTGTITDANLNEVTIYLDITVIVQFV